MPDNNGITCRCLHHCWFLFDQPNSKNGHLRLIDNWSADQTAKRTKIGDCKRPTLKIIRTQFVFAACFSKSI